MIKDMIRRSSDWLRYVITHPMGELNRWQRAARFSYDLGRFGIKQLAEDRASQMAAALTFRTLFSLLPVMVVATILVKAIKGTSQFTAMIQSLLEGWGLYQIAGPNTDTTAAAAGGTRQSLGEFVMGLVAQTNDLNLSAIGWVGACLVIYAAISLMATIEGSFNTIYRAPSGRPWVRRIVMYYFVLTVAPLMLGVMFYLNSQFNTVIETLHAWAWLADGARVVWIFSTVWLLMFLVYWQVPNTIVSWRYALTGAFVATIPLLLGGKLLGTYLGSAMAVSSLYGSLGLVPLLMYWAYLVWLIVLFGLEVAATLQNLRGRQIEELTPRKVEQGVVDPASILELMGAAVGRFREGQPITAREMAEASNVPEEVASRMAACLADAGYLHRVDSGTDNTFALSRPPESVPADALLEIGFALVERHPVSESTDIVERLRQVQKRLASELTLATLSRSPT